MAYYDGLCGNDVNIKASEIVQEDQWGIVRTLLPEDLEQTAVQTLAIIRRRVIKDADTLLRLIFAGKTSARGTCSWAENNEICRMANVSFLERLHYCGDWLGVLVAQKSQQCGCQMSGNLDDYRLRIVDASCISRDGVNGIDQGLGSVAGRLVAIRKSDERHTSGRRRRVGRRTNGA